MGTMTEKEEKLSEGRAGFRPNRSCVDHVYTSGNIIQGRKDAGLTTYCFFLDVQKAYDSSMEKWVVELWKKMWEIGIRGKMVENDENNDETWDKCCDAGRGNIELR